MLVMDIEENEQLIDLIDKKKLELIRIAELFGIHSFETLKCSEELDKLIVQYQRL